MRSTNPVLSRPGAFTPAQGSQQPGYAPYGGYGQPGYEGPAGQYPGPQYQPQAPGRLMTLDDVITKSAITMGLLILAAAVTMAILPIQLVIPSLLVSGLVGFVVVLVVSFRRLVNPVGVLAYAAIEGIFIGALSKVFEMSYPGIVMQAVMGTFFAAAATLFAYRFFNVRVTSKFRRMVMIGTFAFAGVMLLNLILMLFGVNLGLRTVGGFSALAIVASLIGVGLAVMNLVLDFDYIEQGVAIHAPESESWRAAFGLTVTMVWLYTELLRILSYFRNN